MVNLYLAIFLQTLPASCFILLKAKGKSPWLMCCSWRKKYLQYRYLRPITGDFTAQPRKTTLCECRVLRAEGHIPYPVKSQQNGNCHGVKLSQKENRASPGTPQSLTGVSPCESLQSLSVFLFPVSMNQYCITGQIPA